MICGVVRKCGPRNTNKYRKENDMKIRPMTLEEADRIAHTKAGMERIKKMYAYLLKTYEYVIDKKQVAIWMKKDEAWVRKYLGDDAWNHLRKLAE